MFTRSQSQTNRISSGENKTKKCKIINWYIYFTLMNKTSKLCDLLLVMFYAQVCLDEALEEIDREG